MNYSKTREEKKEKTRFTFETLIRWIKIYIASLSIQFHSSLQRQQFGKIN